MSTALIAKLIEAGTPSALVAEVAMELGRAEGVRETLAGMDLAAAVRTPGAVRQARYRERHKASQSVTNVTEVTSDVTRDVTRDASTPILDKESVPQTPFKEINPTPDTQTRPRKTDPFLCPEGVETGHWSDFLANRKAKRLPNTGTAYAGQMRKLAELTDDEWPPGRIVQFCVEKGWGSINDPRESEHRNGRRQPQSSGPGISERAASRVLDEFRAATADPMYGK